MYSLLLNKKRFKKKTVFFSPVPWVPKKGTYITESCLVDVYGKWQRKTLKANVTADSSATILLHLSIISEWLTYSLIVLS